MGKKIELANLVVTAGENGLQDFLDAGLWTLLINSKVPGKGEVRAYRFHDLRLEMVGGDSTGYPCLYGRLVRLMTIQAEQQFDDRAKKIVPSEDSVESAPSSFFLISLADHKLAFFPESKRRSPSLQDIQFTISRILRDDWQRRRSEAQAEMLAQVGKIRIPRGQRDSWEQELERRFPEPEVRITPLAAKMALQKRFTLYEKIQSVEIRPFKTNNELADENAELLRQFVETRKRLGSVRDKFELSNKKQGLNKGEAEQLVTHASDGNFQVKMKGVDSYGRPLNDDLENMRIQIDYPIKRDEVITARAMRVLSILLEALKNHAILIKEPTQLAVQRARDIVIRLRQNFS